MRPKAAAETAAPAGGGEPIESCTIVTTEANELVSGFHHRMPVILDAEAIDAWLGADADELWRHAIAAVTPEDLVRAARTWLAPERADATRAAIVDWLYWLAAATILFIAATGCTRGSRRDGNRVISTSVSRWLLWLAARIAGPEVGRRSRWRTLSPSPTVMTARGPKWEANAPPIAESAR